MRNIWEIQHIPTLLFSRPGNMGLIFRCKWSRDSNEVSRVHRKGIQMANFSRVRPPLGKRLIYNADTLFRPHSDQFPTACNVTLTHFVLSVVIKNTRYDPR